MFNNNVPQFLIIGSKKSYSGKILINLNKHPDIYIDNDSHYFDYYWKIMPKEWYYTLFLKSNKLIKGEESSNIIYIDICAKRVKKICPNTKFILFLQDPIKRAYSSWWEMSKDKMLEQRTFKECIDYNIKNLDEKRIPYNTLYQYVQMGFYIDQIERFLKIFPDPNNLLIIITEKMQNDPKSYYKKIFNFLGAKNVNIDFCDHQKSYWNEIDNSVNEKLKKIYKNHNEKLFNFLGYNIPEWN